MISPEDLHLGFRFVRGLPALLRHRVAVQEARAVLQRRLARREIDFLALARATIYRHPRSPYRELLRLAGCEYGDLERLVWRDHPAGQSARGLYLMSLRLTTSLILLNVSMGDEALLESRACGCPLQQFWPRHLSSIRSHEKLTAGGMTFLDADVVRILEEVLPGRFGGGPTDYQLVEDRGDDGQLRLRLLVHPGVGPVDQEAVATMFLRALGEGDGAQRVMGFLWRDGRMMHVERRPPLPVPRGRSCICTPLVPRRASRRSWYHSDTILVSRRRAMPNVHVRDLSPSTLKALRARAQRHDRSLQAELKRILEETAATEAAWVRTRAAAARLRRQLAGRTHSDSATLIADDRRR